MGPGIHRDQADLEYEDRLKRELHWFPPWSLWLIPTVPLAILSILDAVPWRARLDNGSVRPGPVGRVLPGWLWDREAGPDARFVRGSARGAVPDLGARSRSTSSAGSCTSHMAELFLMFGLWAAHRWAMPAVVLVWLMLTSMLWLIGDVNPQVREMLLRVATHDSRPADEPDKERYLVRYPLADPERLRLWPECWRTDLTTEEQYALWDRNKRISAHEASIDWEELNEVAEFLRARGVKDGELLAWHDSPHALYLMMGIKPGVRYMHINTAQSISMESYARVQAELAATAGTARFAVSDLEYPTLGVCEELRQKILGPPAGPHDLIPAGLQPAFRRQFPFNQKTVFRSRGGLGRYIIHELTPPLQDWPRPN